MFDFFEKLLRAPIGLGIGLALGDTGVQNTPGRDANYVMDGTDTVMDGTDVVVDDI